MPEKSVILVTRSKSMSPECFRGYIRMNLWVQWTSENKYEYFDLGLCFLQLAYLCERFGAHLRLL